MEQGREVVEEVIYEIRQHAAGVFAPDLSQQKGGSASRSSLLSYLSIQGAKQLKQKWKEYRRPRGSKRKMALFVSPDGEHVALAFQNQLVILQRDDDYMEPCGIYIGNDSLSFFTNGAWMEPQGILGVIDDMCTLYLINSNGREITRSTRSELKLTTPIIDLVVLDDVNSRKSYMSAFGIFTAGGLIHSFEVSKEPRASIFRLLTLKNSLKDRSPHNVSCIDFHPDLSLIVLVVASKASENPQSFSGSYSLYLLQVTTNSDLELVFCSPQFEGLFSSTKGHLVSLTSPKVSISPQGKYIATLDLTGFIDVFHIDSDTLSILCFAERLHSHGSGNVPEGRKSNLKDIVDFSWWNDHVLILANSSGYFTMYDVLNDMTVLNDSPHFCMTVIERLKHIQEHVFVLEGRSCEGELLESGQTESKKASNKNQLYDARLHWSLLSISGKSVLEMYRILTCNQQYHSALVFADRHGLDRDEVFKAQWLSCCYGVQDVDLILSKISDHMFVLSECVEKVGPTEDAVKALLSYGIHITEDYLFSDLNNEESRLLWDFRVTRLQLLQYRDKLNTFIGINMGRFSAEEYKNFRAVPVTDAAVNLAESGKIGALNLLFKRHPYSLSQDILYVLSAIPETVPVQSYRQLLPGKNPPATIALRERDWVECERMISFIDKMPGGSKKLIQVRTENVVKLSVGFVWPSSAELVDWYNNRAKNIDTLSGQLENCLALVEFACHNDILELQQFLEDITYLHQLIYADVCTEGFTMGLVEWEQLPDYEKFKVLLKGVTEDSAVETLQEKALPFMQKRFHPEQVNSVEQKSDEIGFMRYEQSDSFLVRWMKEIASGSGLGICLKVIEIGCGESPVGELFKDEAEIVETALECMYSCLLTDQWNVMASILSKLPRKSSREKTLKDVTPKQGNLGSGNPRFSYIRSHLSKSVRQYPLNLHDDSGQNSSGGMDQFVSSVADDNLEKRIKIAEGHVEVGRLLAYYQVPKPISFFLSAESDEKNVKQLLRLILSKFGRRQPGRSDSEWASMWQDMLCFQEKAFPFLDTEYMLIEFCRGLLKAGKFSLARNYLKGTGTIALATEKAEILVVQAAREYFFSASSLSCSEIWKARECLSLFPNSKVVQSEADVIEALTVRLPNLGVALLPVQFRQIRNPMEIINMVISSQTGAYLNVDELIEVAKLLGLASPDDIAAVEEAIVREAAAAGDMQLASDLCLVLANKDHGAIWDLCAAIARSPHMGTMDTSSRKQLLGFALSHCDEESIGELLHAWKDVDMHMHYEQLMVSTETCPPNFLAQGSTIISLPVNSLQDILNLRDISEPINNAFKKDEENIKVHFESLKSILSGVAEECSIEGDVSWDSLLGENRKVLSFVALELPWLLELSSKEEYGRKVTPGAKAPPGKHSISIKFRALIDILHWLAGNDIAPRDELLISLAKSIMVSPVSEEDDILGCSFLLNLFDAFHGVEVIEEQLKQREGYREIYSIMNIGMSYSSIQNLQKEYSSPDQRRKLLLQKVQEKYASFGSDEVEQIDKVHSTFWREWKTKLEEQKRLADQARALEEMVPGVDTDRFLSGDVEYIRGVVFSLIDSVKMQKKHILKEVVKLADTYGLQRMEVLLRFFGSALVSELWGNDDILTEVSQYREDIAKYPKGVVEMISTLVFPEINGQNKQRLSYVYSILSACHLSWSKAEEPALSPSLHHHLHKHIEPFQFYKVLEQECQRVSFIKEFDFKNIATLDKLNYDNFNEEILNNVHDSTVEALADMVRTLVGMCSDTNEKCLISWQDVYKHLVLSLLASLESRTRESLDGKTPEDLQALLGEINLNYDLCKKYIRALPDVDMSHILRRFQKLCIPCVSSWSLTDDPVWKHCLIMVLDLWIKLVDTQVTECCEASEKSDFSNEESLPKYLKIFENLVMEGQISASEGWCTISNYVHQDEGVALSDIPSFLKSMILSGCRFNSIANVYFEAHLLSSSSSADGKQESLLDLYISLTETALSHISHGFAEHRNMHRLLSSLSKIEGSHTDDLMVIRSEVWRKLCAFSDNMQLESNIKVYALELMQCITGQNYRSLPEELMVEVEPWEDCDESCQSKTIATAQGADVSSNITNTLIALKSSRLITVIMPDIKITAQDLSSADSAVTCFLNLCESASSPEDVDMLKAVLEEWEVLFSSTTGEEEAVNSPKEHSEWNNDDWGEGWETLPDELINVEEKEKQSPSIRPLHACWMEIVKMLSMHSRPNAVMELLDQMSSKSDGLLLDEDEAKSLFHMIVEVDCFMALKILLLLPYDTPRLLCLQAIESKLKERGPPNNSNVDEYELLILVLSSGVLQSIIFNPALGNFFSYMCYLVGHLARGCQKDLLKYRDSKTGIPNQSRCLLFGKLLLPCFIAELVEAKQCILAGFMVSQWMHTHPSVGLMDIVEASLRKYLEGQLLQAVDDSGNDYLVAFRSLQCTLSRLRGKLRSLVQSALLALAPNI